MKPKNFPARRLLRQMKAQGKDPDKAENREELGRVRNEKTKKRRVG